MSMARQFGSVQYKRPSLLYTSCLVGFVWWNLLDYMGNFLLFNFSTSLCVVGFAKFKELPYMKRSYFDSFGQNGIKYQVIQRQTSQRILFIFEKLINYLFILAALGLRCCTRAFSSCSERGYPSLQCTGFSLRRLLLLRSTGCRRAGVSSCGTQAQQLWLAGSRAQAQQLWRMDLVSPWHVGSSWTRARTRVPCIGRWILNHCATREAPSQRILYALNSLSNYHPAISEQNPCFFQGSEEMWKFSVIGMTCSPRADQVH